MCNPKSIYKTVTYTSFVPRPKALTDRIRIRISYPKSQQIGFSFVTSIIQIDVPKSGQIRIIARPIHRMLTYISEYPVVWDRGIAAMFFFQIQQSACGLYFWQKAVDGVRNKRRLYFFPFFCTSCFFYFNFCHRPLPIRSFPLACFIYGVCVNRVCVFCFFFYKHWFHFSCRYETG